MPERTAASVSVVIPVFDNEAYLGEAIESVLGQTTPPGEVLVVDDGSADGSAGVGQAFGGIVRVVRQANSGISGARNRGVSEATGSLICFLDADDRWLPGSLEMRIDVLALDPDLELVFGAVAQIRAADWPATISGDRPATEVMPGPSCDTLLVTRDAFDRVGPFDARWRAGEFIDWFARARHAGVSMLGLPDVLAWRRIHDQNHGIRQRAAYADYLGVVKASIDRRRELAAREGSGEP